MSKILVIDDKQDNLISMSALLKNLIPECKVVTADSGEKGIEQAKVERPDTILLDIKMPGLDGYAVCKKLKEDENTQHIPIIMISAIKTESTDLVQGLNLGAEAYLSKPIDEHVLAAQVNTALRIKKAEDSLCNQKDLLESMVQERTTELLQTNLLLKREINERKQVEQEKADLENKLHQAQRMEALGILAGGIAHDFNNVLQAIIGYTELAMANVPEESAAQKNLNEVFKGAMRAKHMVQQILSFSRKTLASKKPTKVQFDVKEALKLLRNSIPTTIEIRQSIDEDCGPVLADATQIHQVVMNLATNAYQAMRENGGLLEVTLREEIGADYSSLDLDPDNTYLKLTVSDTGHGIDPEVMDRIFDPYFTTKDVGEGTGMGLAVVHGIVKSHGGNIKVYSKLGKGTVFHVYLPLIKAVPVEPETVPAEPGPGGAEHILFVDDEEPIVLATQQILERYGYQVTSCTSSAAALEAFKAEPDKYDLVITDMTMPNMTGVELAARLKEIRHNIPTILCTGFSEMIDEAKAKAIGFCEYAMKPVGTANLIRIIRKALDSQQG